jgi:uncharacterized protein
MKILTFTDLHLSLTAFKRLKKKVAEQKPDLLVSAGDLTIFEQGLDFMLKKLNGLKRKVLLVHGNHETDGSTRKLCKKYENLIYLHKTFYKHNGHIFLGYGGGGFSLIEPEFNRTSDKFDKIIKMNRGRKIIFVTHAPPYNTKLDLIIGNHCGNKTFRNFVSKNNIDLYICGHLHENFGKEDKIKKTKVINPGPYGKVLNI